MYTKTNLEQLPFHNLEKIALSFGISSARSMSFSELVQTILEQQEAQGGSTFISSESEESEQKGIASEWIDNDDGSTFITGDTESQSDFISSEESQFIQAEDGSTFISPESEQKSASEWIDNDGSEFITGDMESENDFIAPDSSVRNLLRQAMTLFG